MESIWEQTAVCPAFDSLSGEIQTDVLIIGGGMAGLLCLWRLHQAGVDCMLAEADRICGGTTRNTTAKITSQHGLVYDKLIRKLGIEKAGMYLAANQAAVAEFRAMARNIPCDFQDTDAYVYARKDASEIEKELRALETLHFPAEFVTELNLPFPIAGAEKFPNQAQFHPLKFASAIAKDLKIFEHTPVRELIGTTAVTDYGKIHAQKIIVATHFPFLNKHGSYFLKLYQQRSYLIALENAQNVGGMYVDAQSGGLSFRNYGDTLLLGGGSHRTGKPGEGWEMLRAFAREHYPESREICHWAAQDCMTLDDSAYIGPYSANTKGLYVATGFRKWGMTGSMVSAMILADMVQGKENPWAPAFDPSRQIFRKQLAINAAESTLNLLTPCPKRCPHLGCALKWNPQEHSWDCPCHGSRFTEDGKLLEGPAMGDLKEEKA